MNLNFSNFGSVASAHFQPTQGQVYADLAGELAILNAKTGVYYGLDPVGARIWSLILEFKCIREIKMILLEEYDVSSCYLMSGGYDLLVIIEGATLREVATFVSEKLATIQGVLSTATHFMLKPYKIDGVLMTAERNEERLAVSP